MSKLADDIKNRKWEFLGAAALPLYITIYPPLYTEGFKVRYGIWADIIYASPSTGRAHWFMDAAQLTALAEKSLLVLMYEQWNWYNAWQEELKPFQEFNQKFLTTSLASLTDAELHKLIREYREQFYPSFVTNNVIEALSPYFQYHLKDMLVAEGVEPEQASELIEQYGQAARPSYVKLCAEEYRKATSDEKREAVRQKYYYIFNDYLGAKETTHEELEKLAASTPYKFAQEYITPGISSKAQQLLTVMQIIATVQDVRKAELLEMVPAAKRFGQEYARRKGIPFADIEYATWQEVEDDTVNVADLEARRQPFVMYWTLEGFYCAQGAEAAERLVDTEKYILHSNPNTQEVKGICASKGKAAGRAVVIFSPEEFNKVQPGDILFTIMTRPEFLPVMHRAAAFVCDEGGLTSHAAIVAREMKKPCVIATRIGTRIFKTGDMVEVDAERGVVRVISTL